MKLKLKRTLAFALAFMMSISSVAFADGTKVGTDGKGKTPVLVEQEATNFDVVIPLSFDLFMGGDGKVVSATNSQIINKSFGPIQVENISVTSKNGWSIIDINSDKSKLKIDSKQIGFQLNDIVTTPTFDFTTSNESWIINGNNNAKDLTYGGVMSPTRDGFDKTNAIDTIFTIDWYEKTQPTQEQLNAIKELKYYKDKMTEAYNINEAKINDYQSVINNLKNGNNDYDRAINIIETQGLESDDLKPYLDEYLAGAAGTIRNAIKDGEESGKGTVAGGVSSFVIMNIRQGKGMYEVDFAAKISITRKRNFASMVYLENKKSDAFLYNILDKYNISISNEDKTKISSLKCDINDYNYLMNYINNVISELES